MKKSRSVMTVTADENALDYLECGLSKSYSTSSHTLGIDLWRGRRCCSGNLQLPPLSQRQTEKARTPDRDFVCRPTTLPLLTPPSIAITTYQDWRVRGGRCFYDRLRIKALALWLFLVQVLEERLGKAFESDVKIKKSPKETIRELVKKGINRSKMFPPENIPLLTWVRFFLTRSYVENQSKKQN
ncbi:hypothetical protein AV530_007395 [Patagioenas fasciata monilis]|uniref:cAMP-specific 3',5'-cyclic phosphodiesterase 4B n=1 Tax=Patagioenas fasciata monilis TaxID=372326 RepID=A0A1V4JZ77_PATFA|nr:hypothetical protein AV530_007395 [Patagioenas fasciata monilis]